MSALWPKVDSHESGGPTHRLRKAPEALFAYTVSDNVHGSVVGAVLAELGSDLDDRHHGKLLVHLNGQSPALARAGRTLALDQVRQVRKLLESVGINPAAHPA